MRGSPQPTLGPSVSAYSSAKTARPMVARPGQSMWPEAPGSRDSKVVSRTTTRVRTASGRLSQNSHRQPNPSVTKPLIAGPADSPPQATACQMPNAAVCARPENSGGMRASEAGRIIAAPMPMSPRPRISHSTSGESAATTENTASSTVPIWSISRRPKRSPNFPAAITSAPVTRLKALFAHWSIEKLLSNSSAIFGIATPRSEKASQTIPAVPQIPISESHLCGGSAVCSGDGSVMVTLRTPAVCGQPGCSLPGGPAAHHENTFSTVSRRPVPEGSPTGATGPPAAPGLTRTAPAYGDRPAHGPDPVLARSRSGADPELTRS